MPKSLINFFSCCFALACISLLTECKKDKKADDNNKPVIEKTAEPALFNSVQIDSIKQLSISVKYKLAKAVKSTGYIRELDSINLINNTKSSIHTEAELINGFYQFKISYPPNLPPTGDKIWFRLYITDENGVKTYSPIYSQKIATYEIKNIYVVNGKGTYNKHPKDFYINYEESPIGNLDNSLIVDAITYDVNLQNYKGTLNEVPITLSRIDAIDYPPTHRHILFDVPDDFPLGAATFKLYYQNKLVYSEKIIVINGGLLTSIKHPIPLTTWGAFFEAGGKLYTYANYGLTAADANFYTWTPESNTWQKLPNPKETPNINFNTIKGGRAIKGVIYFPPSMYRPWGLYTVNNPYYYQESITSYNPTTGEWKKKILLNTINESEDRTLGVNDCFVYQDKLYCITTEFPYGQMTGNLKYQMRVYDPFNESWEYYMDLPDNYWGWTAVVNDTNVYLLTELPGKQESATTEYRNEFFLLNITGRSLIKKNWINDRNIGVSKPYLVSYNNKIYVYGGQYSSGYFSLYSSLFAEYNSSQDKWSPVSGYSYYTGWVSQTQGFILPIGSKLYLGLGLDRYTNGNIHGSKVSGSIYNVSLK